MFCRRVRFFALALVVVWMHSVLTGVVWADNGHRRRVITVDCAAGETIAAALAEEEVRVVIVLGTCNENVTISRGDVTLRGHPSGGTVNGPDPTLNTVTVTANRVLIDQLTVTGGGHGIRGEEANQLTIQNSTVSNTGLAGIFFFRSSGTVDNCTVRNNGRNNPTAGVRIEGGSAAIINSTISMNTGRGILVTDGGGGRIGITKVPHLRRQHNQR